MDGEIVVCTTAGKDAWRSTDLQLPAAATATHLSECCDGVKQDMLLLHMLSGEGRHI